MKLATTLSIFLLYVSILISYSYQHSCNGLIVNQTNFTLSLTESAVVRGNLTLVPSSSIAAYGSSTFTVVSDFGLDDRISYTWGYAAQQNWCSTSSAIPFSATFEYDYGTCTCQNQNANCASSGNSFTVTVNNCDGVWAVSSPTFLITYA